MLEALGRIQLQGHRLAHIQGRFRPDFAESGPKRRLVAGLAIHRPGGGGGGKLFDVAGQAHGMRRHGKRGRRGMQGAVGTRTGTGKMAGLAIFRRGLGIAGEGGPHGVAHFMVASDAVGGALPVDQGAGSQIPPRYVHGFRLHGRGVGVAVVQAFAEERLEYGNLEIRSSILRITL